MVAYSDNSRVTGLINGTNQKTLERSRLVKEIKNIKVNKEYFDDFFIDEIKGEANEACYILAQWAVDSKDSPHVADEVSKDSTHVASQLAMDPIDSNIT